MAGTTAAAAMLGTSAGAARAADSDLLLSSDGVIYSQTLARPVFDTTSGFVPGSSSSADIWIRNATTDNAFLSVAALGNGPAEELAADLGLAIHSTLGSTPRTPLGGAGSCTDLAIGWALSPGESLRLTFTLDMDRNSSNATRRQSSGFDVRFLLEDQDGSARSGACRASGGTVMPGVATPVPLPPPVPGAPLAVTGVPDPWAWALAAVAFLTAGTGILAYIRRNKAGSGSDDKK
ncbi:hypothetical protein [Arthrobacter sp. OV608]|uniref:hypothetical protein n=1 Tax=Arthrobacter sp. OV608 TaxID=1882768 RepID=UPI001113CAA1|nr:hypothetical protein [Arthrobacter sp. OV608]